MSIAFPKPQPRLLEKRKRKSAKESQNRAERKLCRLRSGGRCEVIIVTHKPEQSALIQKRCTRAANQNHHLLGGVGRRNIGASILAQHRIDTCRSCHEEITHEVLQAYVFDEQYDAATVRYIRKEWL